MPSEKVRELRFFENILCASARAPDHDDGGFDNAGLHRDETSWRRIAMRWVYLAVIILFALATLIFAVQNLKAVTVSFLGFEGTAPLAVLTILVYILGAFTGGSLLALLRKSYERSQWSMGSSWRGGSRAFFGYLHALYDWRSEAAYACGPTKCLPMLYH
jgi:lipopolysaccharide assembly protein A